MKERLKKLFADKRARLLLVAAAALLLLLLCWLVFGRGESKAAATGGFSPTAEETRLAAILSQVEGAGEVSAVISEEGGKPVAAVVFFGGEDAILTRLRLTKAAAAALNIAENRVYLCPAEK